MSRFVKFVALLSIVVFVTSCSGGHGSPLSPTGTDGGTGNGGGGTTQTVTSVMGPINGTIAPLPVGQIEAVCTHVPVRPDSKVQVTVRVNPVGTKVQILLIKGLIVPYCKPTDDVCSFAQETADFTDVVSVAWPVAANGDEGYCVGIRSRDYTQQTVNGGASLVTTEVRP